ncbi:mechanosensitive ion channel family protein [Haloferula sp.]|uniref:mechanosensitive ion channel family protein n=1 Tax=Haloferula sp. TaxID=2497595 RepID=UPI00329DBD87
MNEHLKSWWGRITVLVCLSFAVSVTGTGLMAKDESADLLPLTAESEISIETLRVKVRPLEVDQLEVELESWVDLLKEKITEVGEVEIQINALEKAGDDSEKREALKEKFIELRTQEADLVARTKVVISALAAKGGDASETESYIAAISDLAASGDSESRAAAIVAASKSWLRSPDGGLRLLKQSGLAIGIILVFWIISRYAGKAVGKGLEKRKNISGLLTNFAKKMAGGLVFVVGLLMALSALGVSVGPVMAAMGAGGFIIGFALQETLGNFASGLMIMIYRPFDLKDYVSIAGDEGVVKEMSLVSTTLLSLDNKVLIIPNKGVWGNTIINFTGEDIRRVDMTFGIGYGDDIPKAMKVLEEMAAAHPMTLEDPKVSVQVVELGDSSVNLCCRPWVKSSDYWPVMWELTRDIKMRFDEDGISIPFPQRDVHMIQG